MIYKKVDDLRFSMFFIISALLNIGLVLLIPSCGAIVKNNELKYENIRTGLISLEETNKKEFEAGNKPETVTQTESFSKETLKSTVAEKITPVETKVKSAGNETSVANTNSTSKPKFTGPSRDEDGVAGVITSSSSKSLREKSEGVFNGKTSSNNDTELNIKGNDVKGVELQSKNLQGGTKILETGNFDKNSIGIDTKNGGNKEKDSYIAIKDTGINNSIPKNISYSTVDVTGGRVVFRKYTAPLYPSEAEENGWNGDVEVEFIVRDGKTTFVGISGKSGYSVIDRAVEKAAKNWLLAIEKNGVSVNGKVRVKVEFNF